MLQSDEQTESWQAFVQDIHIDRTDGNRQRQMNYDYAQSKLYSNAPFHVAITNSYNCHIIADCHIIASS